MAKKKEMCSLENHEPGAGIVLMKLDELHSFEGHPFKVERNVRIFCQSQFYRNNRIEHLILNFCMSRQNS